MTLADRERAIRDRRAAFLLGAQAVVAYISKRYSHKEALKRVLENWLAELETWAATKSDVEMPKLPGGSSNDLYPDVSRETNTELLEEKP